MATRKAGAAVAPRASTEVAVRTPPPLEIDASDVSLPAIKVGQYMSEPVKHKLVEFGDIYASTSADDGDPQVIGTVGDKEGIPFHVLGMRRGRSANVDGELERYDYDDPAAPQDSWVTYQYFIVLPDHDQELPYKLLLTKTNAPAAKQLNLALKRNQGLPWELAFTLHAAQRQNAKGEYCIFQVRSSVPETAAQRKAHEANVTLCADLAVLVGDQPAAGPAATGDSPDI